MMIWNEYGWLLVEFVIVGKFWGSSGLAVMLPNFHKNCGLRIYPLHTYLCLVFEYYVYENVRCNIRNEIIGCDPSKGKVIHNDKISECDPSKGNVTH